MQKFRPLRKMNAKELARFKKYCHISGPGSCWEWVGLKATRDYGKFFLGDKQYAAHRVSYRHFASNEDVFLELDHKCRNHSCVNPAHLEPVTHKENMRRGETPAMIVVKTKQCKRGHDLSKEENLLPYYLKQGRTVCKPCEVMRIKKFYDNKRRDGATL